MPSVFDPISQHVGLMQVAPYDKKRGTDDDKTINEGERDSLPMSSKTTLISGLVDAVMVAVASSDRT